MVARIRNFAVALPIAFVLGSFAAQAQTNPFRQTEGTISQPDTVRMREAALPLYSAEPPKVGATASWQDQMTGNYGTVALVGVFEWHGMSCRELQHVVKIKGVRDPVRMNIDRCKTENGEWKIRY